MKYLHTEIERKWQKKWKEQRLYSFDFRSKKPKFYTLVELPYTSGDLHVGHWFNWATPEAYSRFKRMQGFNVFFPHGYDAIGLPAENAAIKKGIHPRDWTMKNIETMQAQFETMGSMIKLDDPVVTCSNDYFKWNQWIFIKMFERGIAYRGKALSNWCPQDKTVLADEHVEGGKCWRCGSVVEKKEVEQWFIKITEYADRLIWPFDSAQGKSAVDWPRSVREGQNNWIGKSEGMLIKFKILNLKFSIEVFTTRPETTDGATFLVLAPEHEIVASLLNSKFKIQNSKLEEIKKYIGTAKKKTEQERITADREKTGVFTGLFAKNPVTGKEIPVWVADYVLSGYGTGAIMAVPDGDERDREFAEKFNLPIIKTSFNAKPGGEKKVNYHIRDWSISRQRYWGTPVPMIHCDKCGIVPVPEEDLPVELPYEVDFTPTGKPPLATNEKWLKVKCPNCKGDAKRDPETLDTFFDSAWYYYRYVSPHYNKAPFDKKEVREMMPVDVYFGGAEHTLGHTLYARFFTKFFKDLGLVEFDEFAKKRIQHGIVLGPDGNKMSKSKGNVINPDDIVGEYGADTVRLYLCFMMPYEGTAPWSTTSIAGMYRFLQRVWQLQFKVQSSKFKVQTEDLRMMHKTIKKVTEDLESIKLNTAIAALMEWLNFLSKKSRVWNLEFRVLLLLLAPFAPHMTEELWEKIATVPRSFPPVLESQTPSARRGGPELTTAIFSSIHLEKWPQYDSKYLIEDEINIPVQVDGKLRGVVLASPQASERDIVAVAKKDEKIAKYLEGRKYKTIYIKGKILNFTAEG